MSRTVATQTGLCGSSRRSAGLRQIVRAEQPPARRAKEVVYSSDNVWTTQCRPFVKQRCYVDYVLVNDKYQMDRIFPAANSDNRAICGPGIGSTKPFSALVVDTMPDLELRAVFA